MGLDAASDVAEDALDFAAQESDGSNAENGDEAEDRPYSARPWPCLSTRMLRIAVVMKENLLNAY
jgi:hypothetical protein